MSIMDMSLEELVDFIKQYLLWIVIFSIGITIIYFTIKNGETLSLWFGIKLLFGTGLVIVGAKKAWDTMNQD